jgi:riboflavin kinase/FMN adenylyltransferase
MAAMPGTIETLRTAGHAHGFGVEQIAPFVSTECGEHGGARAAGTADYPGAARLLGRPYRMLGRVVPGRRLGRTLGFPTANLRLMRRKSPVWGISAVWTYGIDSRPLPGVASLGTRPTVNGTEPLLEVHVFDFCGDLYGRAIEVEFVAKLRDEVKFDSLDAMTVQMQVDARQARDLLSKVNSG